MRGRVEGVRDMGKRVFTNPSAPDATTRPEGLQTKDVASVEES